MGEQMASDVSFASALGGGASKRLSCSRFYFRFVSSMTAIKMGRGRPAKYHAKVKGEAFPLGRY
jgi:hypothetical protein